MLYIALDRQKVESWKVEIITQLFFAVNGLRRRSGLVLCLEFWGLGLGHDLERPGLGLNLEILVLSASRLKLRWCDCLERQGKVFQARPW